MGLPPLMYLLITNYEINDLPFINNFLSPSDSVYFYKRMPLPDLFRQIREHHKTRPLKIDTVDCGNVITRDQTRFFSEDDPDRWRKKFHRQLKHNTRGVFSRHTVPYRALGDGLTHYGLNAEEIVWKALKMPPKKTTFHYVSTFSNETTIPL